VVPTGSVADDDVVARAKQGDGDAWRTLYRAHAGRLTVWLATRDNGDSALSGEDVAAEAWLVAARKIHDFGGSSDDFAGWLFGIARNINGNAQRRSYRRRTDPGVLDEQLAPLPDATLVIDQQSWVRELLSVLPQRERDVIGCLEVVGLDTAATAEALGIKVGAVRVARHRGLRRLRAAHAGLELAVAEDPS
jgi:RNA polymerase sigma-70 factor, ECF subfamily